MGRQRSFRVRRSMVPLVSIISVIGLGMAGLTETRAQPGWHRVSFGGATFEVPTAWPVYNLAASPSRCVRLDVPAVYLGTPGSQQSCPAGLVGRSDGLLIQPLARAPQTQVAQARVPATVAGQAVLVNGNQAETGTTDVVLAGQALLVTVSHGARQSVANQVLDSLRTTSGSAASASAPAATPNAATPAARAAASPQGVAAASPQVAPAVVTPAASTSTSSVVGPGVDACAAPSLSTMNAWLTSPYRTMGVYIGGINRACNQPNLSASWVSSVEAQGWHPVATYVGRQAPCNPQYVTIDPADAAAQGRDAADDATTQASINGIGRGNPIYFDMESYDNSQPDCSVAAVAFLDSWTVGLHANGYVSGIYGSAATTIVDLRSKVGNPAYHLPDQLWFADWNGVASAFGDPFLPDSMWNLHQRMHQYEGGHDETWGGVTINVDSDYDDGLVSGQAGLPGAPGHVAAVAGDGSARVTWTLPNNSGSALTGSTVTVSPGGTTVNVGATTTSVTFGGLFNKIGYSFTVRSANGLGSGPVSVQSNTVIPQSVNAGSFFPLTPARVLDTRLGVGARAGPVPGHGVITAQLAGQGGVPSTGVAAVVLHVTATNVTRSTFVTVWPAGAAQPPTSSLNAAAGTTPSNLIVSQVSSGGAVTVYNDQGNADVVADVVGWYSDGANGPGSQFVALSPARVLDTRSGRGAPMARLQANQTVNVTMAGVGGVPSTGVTAVVFNLTATDVSQNSFVTAWPAGQSRPLASSLNVSAGQTIPNLAVAAIGSANQVSLFNSAGALNLIADVVGYYSTGAGGHFHPVVPTRLLDTRNGTGTGVSAPIGPGGAIGLKVAGTPGVASGATSAVLNVTAADASAATFLTVYPSDVSRPTTSSLNVVPGVPVSNLVATKLSVGGRISIFNAQGNTNVVADLVGWFAPS